jgi:GTPase SAR1 family protein
MSSRDDLTPLQQELYDQFETENDDVVVRALSLEGSYSDGDFAAVFAVLSRLPELSRLNLTYTHIGDGGLRVLTHAAQRGAFPQLQSLELDSTQVGNDGLIALAHAAEKGAFPQLQSLELNCTQVDDDGLIVLAHAGEWGAFPLLQTLWLDSTQVGNDGLIALAHAAEKGAFPQLQELWFHDTPAIEGFPKSQYDPFKPRETLRLWLQWHEDKTSGTALNECRVLLVGEGEVGKTSLCNALLGISNEDIESTWGVEIHRGKIIPNVEDGITHTLHCWDFGGQHLMHATHRYYFEEFCLYLLVLDSTRPAEGYRLGHQEKQKDHKDAGNQLDYWLRLIKRYAGNSPVIVVRTKVGAGASRLKELKFPELRARYGVNLLFSEPLAVECPRGPASDLTQARKTVLAAIEKALSDHENLAETQELRSRIHGNVATYFRSVRDALCREAGEKGEEAGVLRKQGRISRATYDQFCDGSTADDRVPRDKREDLLLQYHKLGEMLNYGDTKQLRDWIFDIEWINNIVYAVLDLEKPGPHTPYSLLDAIQLKLSYREDLKKIHAEDWERVLEVMLKFETSLMVGDEKNKQYIIPSLNPPMDRALRESWQPAWDKEEPIECSFEANRTMQRLVARLQNVVKEIRCFRDGAILTSRSGTEAAFIVEDKKESFRIALRGGSIAGLEESIATQLDDLWAKVWLHEDEDKKLPLPERWRLPGRRESWEGMFEQAEGGSDSSVNWGDPEYVFPSKFKNVVDRFQSGKGVPYRVVELHIFTTAISKGSYRIADKPGRPKKDAPRNTRKVHIDDLWKIYRSYCREKDGAEKDDKLATRHARIPIAMPPKLRKSILDITD